MWILEVFIELSKYLNRRVLPETRRVGKNPAGLKLKTPRFKRPRLKTVPSPENKSASKNDSLQQSKQQKKPPIK
jgi:hypothetical protein